MMKITTQRTTVILERLFVAKVVDGDIGDIDERKSGRRTEGGVPET